MLNKTRFIRHTFAPLRFLRTSSVSNFKFKFTEDMAREQERKMKEQEEKEALKQPELALTTKESSLLIGKVSHEKYKKVFKIGVPKHRLNEFFMMYIRESDNIYALDENDLASPGDWVLIRRKNNIEDDKVKHVIEKVVYRYGNFVDPLTNRRSFGIYYDEDYKDFEKVKLDL